MRDPRSIAAATEAALISRTGLGDERAFDVLVTRHHAALTRFAGLVVPPERRRALVETTFAVAHTTLRRMLGPGNALRPYLLLLAQRLGEEDPARVPVDPIVVEQFAGAVPFREPRAGEPHAAVSVEFSRLPEAWQLLVWHLEVEADAPEAASALVGVSPAVVPALVTGARSTLRRALIEHHLSARLPSACVGHTLRLGRSQGTVVPKVVLRHAAQCRACGGLLADLDAVEHRLGTVVARHLLGAAADGYAAVRRSARDSAHWG